MYEGMHCRPTDTELARELAARGAQTSRGNRVDKKFIYRMLNNRAYIGETAHKGTSYPGEHKAIIDRAVWDQVHIILTESPRKGGQLYCYYVSQTVLKHGAGSCPVGRVPAGEIEAAVIAQLRTVFRQPEILAGTRKAAGAQDGDIAEADAREALTRFNPLWDKLFPAEQARIVALLVERIDIGTGGLNVRLRLVERGGRKEMQMPDGASDQHPRRTTRWSRLSPARFAGSEC